MLSASCCVRCLCSVSGDDDAKCKLVIASSADYTSDSHVYSGSDVSAWKDCEIPGQSVFII